MIECGFRSYIVHAYISSSRVVADDSMSSSLKLCWRSYQERRAARRWSRDIDRQLKIQQVWERKNAYSQVLLFGKEQLDSSVHVIIMLLLSIQAVLVIALTASLVEC